MKTFIKSTLLLICGAMFFTACDDDRDNNPTIQEPTTFVLNTPSYAKANVDLATSTSLSFSWSQPAYGFPALAAYQIQMSPTNTWTKDIHDGELDDAGSPVGNFKTFDNEFSVVRGELLAADVAKGLEEIMHWTKDGVPASQTVYVRVRSVYAGDTIYSNTVTINVLPYYVELKPAAPVVWYLIGNCIGDGSWSNGGAANVGQSLVPLYMIDGQEYDRTTGEGKISYTGYFPGPTQTADGEWQAQFKLIKTPGSWDSQIDYSKFTNIASNDAFATNNDGNVVVMKGGYYTITVDTKAQTATIEEYAKTAKAYTTMFLAGGYNGWSTTEDAMSPISTYEFAENHNWFKQVTFTEEGEFKFTDSNDWWGGDQFPYGTMSTSSGGNNKYKAGTYNVFFNDITGQFNFIEVTE